jgi:hypothetical protein
LTMNLLIVRLLYCTGMWYHRYRYSRAGEKMQNLRRHPHFSNIEDAAEMG